MPLESYLTEGETILTQEGNFYATNKRLIRYQKHLIGEEFDDIPYSHLSSVGLIRKPRRGLIKAGKIIIIVVLISLLILAIISAVLPVISTMLGPLLGTPGTRMSFNIDFLMPLLLIGLAVGVVLILLGGFLPEVFIQFLAPGLNKDAEARFRLSHTFRRQASQNLLRTIRQQSLGAGESEIARAKPPEN